MGDDLKALPHIDEQPYINMGSALKGVHKAIDDGIATRRGYLKAALDGWSGKAAERYLERFTTGDTDAHEIAGMLDGTIKALVGEDEYSILSTVRRENERRRRAREWIERLDKYKKDHPRHWYDPTTWFTSADYESKPEVGPMPREVPEPEPKKEAPTAPPKRDPNLHNPSRAV